MDWRVPNVSEDIRQSTNEVSGMAGNKFSQEFGLSASPFPILRRYIYYLGLVIVSNEKNHPDPLITPHPCGLRGKTGFPYPQVLVGI